MKIAVVTSEKKRLRGKAKASERKARPSNKDISDKLDYVILLLEEGVKNG